MKNVFAQVAAKLKAMGAKPEDPTPRKAGDQNIGYTCKNTSSDILSWLTAEIPKCWNCRLELRKDQNQPGDHQAIVCRSYRKDKNASKEKEILFDWWGDNYGLNYKGDVNGFRRDYPTYVYSWFNPYFNDCSGNPFSPTGRPRPRPGFPSSTGIQPK